jgi:molybdopterin-binding protein/molybdate transport repressor ModE-like protein
MTGRARYVGADETALLSAIGRSGSVVVAARATGMTRDRAVYRLGRLARLFGGPLVVAARGGRRHGTTRLTALGASVLRSGYSASFARTTGPQRPTRGTNVLYGTFRKGPPPSVALGPEGPELRVAFDAVDGEAVGVALDPEAIVLAERPFRSSARNVLRAEVTGRPSRPRHGEALVRLRLGRARLRALVTAETVTELGIRPGATVWLLVKATALRPVAPRRRSR